MIKPFAVCYIIFCDKGTTKSEKRKEKGEKLRLKLEKIVRFCFFFTSFSTPA